MLDVLTVIIIITVKEKKVWTNINIHSLALLSAKHCSTLPSSSSLWSTTRGFMCAPPRVLSEWSELPSTFDINCVFSLWILCWLFHTFSAMADLCVIPLSQASQFSFGLISGLHLINVGSLSHSCNEQDVPCVLHLVAENLCLLCIQDPTERAWFLSGGMGGRGLALACPSPWICREFSIQAFMFVCLFVLFFCCCFHNLRCH